jgi:hypothetical protein
MFEGLCVVSSMGVCMGSNLVGGTCILSHQCIICAGTKWFDSLGHCQGMSKNCSIYMIYLFYLYLGSSDYIWS